MSAKASSQRLSSRRRYLIIMSLWGSLMENSLASDVLDPAAKLKINFTVSDRIGSPDVSAAITLSADGLQRLPPDGELAVNGQIISPKKLQKQGFWYQDRVPRAAQYELRVRRSKVAVDTVLMVRPRVFLTRLPQLIDRAMDLRIGFDGAAIGATDSLYFRLTSVGSAAAPQGWRLVLKGEVQGNMITISSEQLAAAAVGDAVLHVGLTCRTASDNEDELVYAVGAEEPVRIKN